MVCISPDYCLKNTSRDTIIGHYLYNENDLLMDPFTNKEVIYLRADEFQTLFGATNRASYIDGNVIDCYAALNLKFWENIVCPNGAN